MVKRGLYACRMEASSSFLKKRTKKLLFLKTRRRSNARANSQKFLLLFTKRSAFLLSMCLRSKRQKPSLINLHRRRPSGQPRQSPPKSARSRHREMRLQRSRIRPAFNEHQAKRVVQIGMNIMGDAAGLGAAPRHMLHRQAANFHRRLRPCHNFTGNNDDLWHGFGLSPSSYQCWRSAC